MEPERDPLLAALIALPRTAPDDTVDQATRRAALDALEQPAPESLLVRIAISGALALTTLLYLQWAVLAASSLY